jgi:hypothetical protein
LSSYLEFFVFICPLCHPEFFFNKDLKIHMSQNHKIYDISNMELVSVCKAFGRLEGKDFSVNHGYIHQNDQFPFYIAYGFEVQYIRLKKIDCLT